MNSRELNSMRQGPGLAPSALVPGRAARAASASGWVFSDLRLAAGLGGAWRANRRAARRSGSSADDRSQESPAQVSPGARRRPARTPRHDGTVGCRSERCPSGGRAGRLACRPYRAVMEVVADIVPERPRRPGGDQQLPSAVERRERRLRRRRRKRSLQMQQARQDTGVGLMILQPERRLLAARGVPAQVIGSCGKGECGLRRKRREELREPA